MAPICYCLKCCENNTAAAGAAVVLKSEVPEVQLPN